MSQLDEIIKDLNKDKKRNMVTIGDKEVITEKIPFSSPMLNYMTYGGIPRNKITELSGEEGGGKTTTALDLVKNAQQLFQKEYNDLLELHKNDSKKLEAIEKEGPRRVVYVDCENTLQLEWAEKIGVDTSSLVIVTTQEEYAEEVFEIIVRFVESNNVGLVILDSIGVLISKQAYEKSIEDKTYGGISQGLTLFSKHMVMSCSKYKCTFVAINQLRADLTSLYPGATTTVGGKAWRHNCMMRLSFRKGHFVDKDNKDIPKSRAEAPAGNIVEVSIDKTKSCVPNRRNGSYIINYTKGIDIINDLIDLGLHQGVIEQKGSWLYIKDENDEVEKYNDIDLSFQGKAKLYNFLEENEDFRKELEEVLASTY